MRSGKKVILLTFKMEILAGKNVKMGSNVTPLYFESVLVSYFNKIELMRNGSRKKFPLEDSIRLE